jgi:hypothetical protein
MITLVSRSYLGLVAQALSLCYFVQVLLLFPSACAASKAVIFRVR